MLGTLLLLATPLVPAHAQTAVTRDDVIAKLDHFETAADLDVPALRLQVAERSKSRGKDRKSVV